MDEAKKCLTGQSESGICGAAAYCSQPYKCCTECGEDCNVRCGWTDRKKPDKQDTQGNGLDGLLNEYRNIVFFDTETTGFNAADYLDTLTIYKDRAAYPHKLANAIEHYGLSGKVVNSHRAIDDVKALLEVTKAMGAERRDLRDYVNIFGYNPKYGISGRHLKKVSYLQQGFRNEIAPPGQTLPKIHEGGGGS